MIARLLALVLLVWAGAATAQPVAMTHVRVIDGRGGVAEDATLLVDAGRIVAVLPRGSVPPTDAVVRDMAGRTIMPGLISTHVHVGQVKGTSVGAQNHTRENMAAQLGAYGRAGATTVMSLGFNGRELGPVRADAHAGRIRGADMFGVYAGIGAANGGPPDAIVHPGPDNLFRPATPDAAREAVRTMHAQGTDLVKFWLDDFGGKVPVKMPPAVYRAVIDEAHRLGLRVAAHIHDLEDGRAVVLAGADMLAHGIRDRPVDASFVRLAKDRNVWVIPTLSREELAIAWAERPGWTQDAFVRDLLSPEVRAQIDDPAWRARTLATKDTNTARRDLAQNLANVGLLYRAGVKIGFGTDSGGDPYRVPGVAEHRELALLVRAGLTSAQAITVATRDAAALLGLADRGTLEPGRRADFIVLAADPLDDVRNTMQVVEVWREGRRLR